MSTRILLRLMVLLLGIGAPIGAAWAATTISACPYTIATPGDYVLRANLTAAGTCITIAANTVTIDLRRHTITGNGTGFGITDGGALVQAIVIANGTIQNFDTGIGFVGQVSFPITITEMAIRENTHAGIVSFGYTTVINSESDNNGGDGINFFNTASATANLATSDAVFASEASENQGNGIVGNGPTFVTSSKTNFNALSGMMLHRLSQVTDSEANGNGGDGIDLALDPGTFVTGSTAHDNAGAGITLLCPSNAVSNTAKFNGAGNLVEAPGVIGAPSPACANFNNTAP
jgi:hypothetical protein